MRRSEHRCEEIEEHRLQENVAKEHRLKYKRCNHLRSINEVKVTSGSLIDWKGALCCCSAGGLLLFSPSSRTVFLKEAFQKNSLGSKIAIII